MKWFKFSGMLVPSNMVFFVEVKGEDSKTWDWANGVIMYRADKTIMDLIENYLRNSDERIFTLNSGIDK